MSVATAFFRTKSRKFLREVARRGEAARDSISRTARPLPDDGERHDGKGAPSLRTQIMAQRIKTARVAPRFADDESAAKFFGTHDTSQIWHQMHPARPIRLPPEQIRVMRERYEQRALSQILGLNAREVSLSRRIARRKAIAVETQLREWIAEGIRRDSRKVSSKVGHPN